MLNLCQSWLLKLDIACHCSLFGSFGKYRNRTESTDTEFPRYRVSAGTDRYRLTEEPNLYGYRRTEPIGSVLPNAQGDLRHTPSFPVYKAYTYIKIQTFSSLTNNLTIKFLFL